MTRPRILAIDDTPANLLLLGAALDAEFELQIATSGALGLALAAKAPPDLILLDVMMPEMDGYETCRRIKADPRLRSIPLVFVTALTENDAESAGLALGAVDYITKPVNVEIARQRLRNLLEREQLRKALEAERDMLEQRVAERTAELLELSGVREAALTAAEQLSALKTQFISNMSHELRTPLHQVIGLAALTRRAKDLAKAQEHAQKILTAGQHLLEIVESVLDFSAVDAGKMLLETQPFELSILVDSLTASWEERARAKGLAFQIELAEDLPVTIVGDSKRILQVLTQLLGNAVKFTTQGKVSLTLRRDAGQLEFAVSDTGIGMTAEQLAAGFNPFQQTDGSATRRFGGLGLGLALIQRLAQLMGGKIRGTSQPGQGTTFYFSLPLA